MASACVVVNIPVIPIILVNRRNSRYLHLGCTISVPYLVWWLLFPNQIEILV